MGELEANVQKLKSLYELALVKRLCSSKKEFGELVGVSRSAITDALNGNPTYATNKMVCRVTHALEELLGNAGDDHEDVPHDSLHEWKTEDLRHIVDRLVDEMAKQRESYERMLMAALNLGGGQKGVK